ncbi:hypothetical protein V6N13_141697 [Hibiscus sabdariffa]
MHCTTISLVLTVTPCANPNHPLALIIIGCLGLSHLHRRHRPYVKSVPQRPSPRVHCHHRTPRWNPKDVDDNPCAWVARVRPGGGPFQACVPKPCSMSSSI